LGDVVRSETEKVCPADQKEKLEKQVLELKKFLAQKETESLTLQRTLIEKTLRFEEATRQRNENQNSNEALTARVAELLNKSK
jgi:hypothetical protein